MSASESAETVADLARMRAQWRAGWVAADYEPTDPALASALARIGTDARRWWSTMATEANRRALWEDARLDVHRSFAISRSFDRLFRMALGWATRGSDTHQDPKLLADLIDGLDWMVARYYRADGEILGNWFEWMISGPRALNLAAMLVFDHLTPARLSAYTSAVAHYTPEPIGTAANRALTADVVVGRGALAGDATTVRLGVDGLAPVLAYVEEGDGFHRDGSFLQHNHYPYNGSYGVQLLGTLPAIFARVAGTPFALEDGIVLEWIRTAFDPLIWRGGLMDLASGRVIARHDEQDHHAGHTALDAALGLLVAASEEVRSWLAPLVREWLEADTLDDGLRGRGIPTVLAARALLTDDSLARRGPLEVSHVFAGMDRVVHRKAAWAYGVSMRSRRIASFESINEENLRGWLSADGATYLYDDRLDHYNDGFWPTVDPYRIPGTTVDVRERGPGEGRGHLNPADWVGGTTLERRYTAAGMRLSSQGCSLVSQKSWFCFDDEVVALGAGITAHDGRRVETVVENRRLRTSAAETVLVDGRPAVARPGDLETATNAGWVHLAGTGGYVFPGGADLTLTRDRRTGRWSDLTRHPSWTDDTALVRDFLTIWLDHGVDPDRAGYAYVLLPTADAETTRRYAARPGVAVVANTGAVQAVRALATGVLGVNLWTAGASASIVSADAPGCVVLREGAEEVAVAMSDPTRLAEKVRFTMKVRATKVLAADPGVRVVALDPLTVEVDLAGARGQSRSLRVAHRPWALPDVRACLADLAGAGEVAPAARERLAERLDGLDRLAGPLDGADVAEATEGTEAAWEALWALRRSLADLRRDDRLAASAVDVLDDGVQRLFARRRG
ncbi:polysaccharide lyase 8 family protein [Actinopolymorpha pittospori]|uniref:Hyaluronate lyase n=1 Tax=Actinopolymorpha pittospori TaxID=648752 RepID=A0A927R9R6_9ACTN|nr:polysaccharide lyase 8 family protein [Actinopolymorpha pittospori]MBE1606784.1 hyaluronate lyase [Actinopolymorpha pittospori]